MSERVMNWTLEEEDRLRTIPMSRKSAAYRFYAEYPAPRPGRAGQSGDFKLRGGAMKIVTAIIFLVTLAGCADMRGLVRIEQASAGKSYDYIVHVQNTFSIGYNPEVRVDRNRMALRVLQRLCPAGQIFGEDKIITELWRVTSSPPDYIVLVKCA